MAEKIKAMIIDDSALIRNLITRILSNNDQIEVVGTALNGKFGLAKLNSLKPDIIILDLEMPEMNGIDFLKERSKLNIKTPVIILSSHAKKGAKITLDALSLGASDFVLKPSEPGSSIEETGPALIELVLGLGKPHSFVETKLDPVLEHPLTNRLIEIKQETFDYSSHIRNIDRLPERIDMITIGISTGGPNALRDILPLFPDDFPVPITIVQHMPPGFTFEFANSLDRICGLSVKEAEDNDIIKPGRILIAPGDKHVIFEKKSLATVVKLDNRPQVNGHRPSADVLFESAAETYGGNSIACIMTGMGKDGAEKIGLIMRKGGITIAQDQESSIVFGMPKVAIEKGNINLVRPLRNFPETIINIVNNRIV
jgi:two-component system, chemotaxis family, protein-glutamate methylesterase/glutaminase